MSWSRACGLERAALSLLGNTIDLHLHRCLELRTKHRIVDVRTLRCRALRRGENPSFYRLTEHCMDGGGGTDCGRQYGWPCCAGQVPPPNPPAPHTYGSGQRLYCPWGSLPRMGTCQLAMCTLSRVLAPALVSTQAFWQRSSCSFRS